MNYFRAIVAAVLFTMTCAGVNGCGDCDEPDVKCDPIGRAPGAGCDGLPNAPGENPSNKGVLYPRYCQVVRNAPETKQSSCKRVTYTCLVAPRFPGDIGPDVFEWLRYL